MNAAVASILLAIPILALPSQARCDLYADTAAKAGVPASLLVAVAGAESGFHPLAINIAGRSYYPRTEEEALALLEGAQDADIGLMQINYRFWGPRLHLTPHDLLDPAVNLGAGAAILKTLLDEPGGFWKRVGGYHSASSQAQARWSGAVYRSYLSFLHGCPAASCGPESTGLR